VRLCRNVLRIEEIANADADEAKPLLWPEGDAFPERECDRRQLFARRGRERRSVAAREDLELRSLQFQRCGSSNPPFVARCGRGQFYKLADHRLRLAERHVAFKRVFCRDRLCRPIGHDFALVHTARQFVETDAQFLHAGGSVRTAFYISGINTCGVDPSHYKALRQKQKHAY